MSKSVDTLVHDIYQLFENGHECSEENANKFGEELASVIKDRLKSYGVHRKGGVYMSNLGKKDRYIFMEANNYKSEPIPPNAKIKFLFGDILETMLLFLAKEAGHKVEGEQDVIYIEGIKGRRDAVIDGVTVDVKSASPYSFKKFKESKIHLDDPFGYMIQLAGYTQGSGEKHVDSDYAAFLAIDKVNGTICLDKHHDIHLPNASQRAKEVNEMLAKGEMPEKCYDEIPEGKSGNMKLPINCSYCKFKDHCWSDSNDGKGLRKFLYSNGITYLTKVVREPKVKEIT